MERERWAVAAKLLAQICARDPSDALPLAMLARCNQRLDRPGYLKLARNAFRLDPEDLYAGYTLATMLTDHGQYPEAEKLGYSLLTTYPEDTDVFYLLSIISLNRGEDETALELVEQGLAFQPEHRQALIQRTRCLRSLGRPEALGESKRLLGMFPNGDALSNYGRALLEEGRNAEAEEVFNHALKLHAQDEEALDGLKEVYSRRFVVYRFAWQVQRAAWWLVNKGVQDNKASWLWLIFTIAPVVLAWKFYHWERYPEVVIPIFTVLMLLLGMRPLGNLILRFHPQARHILLRSEKWESFYWIFAFGTMVGSGIGAANGLPWMLDLALAGAVLWVLIGSPEKSPYPTDRLRLAWMHAFVAFMVVAFPVYLWVSELWAKV